MTVWRDDQDTPKRTPEEVQQKRVKLRQAVLRLIQSYPGGLKNFLQLFAEKDLGEVAESWVGKGDKEQATPQDIQLALGVTRIEELAKTCGLTPGETSESLTAILPQVINALTPDGIIPEGEMLDESIELLKNRL